MRRNTVVNNTASVSEKKTDSGLRHCIEKGLAEAGVQAAEQLLEHESPTTVIDREIIPALDEVGGALSRKRCTCLSCL